MKNRWFVMVIIIGLQIITESMLYSAGPSPTMRVIWRASEGESIYWVGNSSNQGHIFVATQKQDNWFLYDIDAYGRTQLVTSGQGHLQGMNAFSEMSADGRYIALCFKDDSKFTRFFGIYDFNIKNLHMNDDIQGVVPYFLLRPFSFDGKWMVFCGKRVSVDDKRMATFMMDMSDFSVHKLINDGGYLSWDAKGRCYLCSPKTRLLYTYKDGNVSSARIDAELMGNGLTTPCAYVRPEGDVMIMVSTDVGENKLMVYAYGMESGTMDKIYDNMIAGSDVSQGFLGVQYSPWNKSFIVNFASRKIPPLIIDATNKVKEIKCLKNISLDEYRILEYGSGIAFISNDEIAMARMKSYGENDAVIGIMVND